MSVLWERVTQLIEKRNSSIYAVQKATGLSVSSLSRWNESKPSGENILKVANYFDVSVDYLLGNTDNPQSHKNDPAKLVPAVTDFKKMIDKLADVSNDAQRLLTTYQLQADLPDGASSKNKFNE